MRLTAKDEGGVAVTEPTPPTAAEERASEIASDVLDRMRQCCDICRDRVDICAECSNAAGVVDELLVRLVAAGLLPSDTPREASVITTSSEGWTVTGYDDGTVSVECCVPTLGHEEAVLLAERINELVAPSDTPPSTETLIARLAEEWDQAVLICPPEASDPFWYAMPDRMDDHRRGAGSTMHEALLAALAASQPKGT